VVLKWISGLAGSELLGEEVFGIGGGNPLRFFDRSFHSLGSGVRMILAPKIAITFFFRWKKYPHRDVEFIAPGRRGIGQGDPRIPLVGSMISLPGLSHPSRSAAQIMLAPMRH